MNPFNAALPQNILSFRMAKSVAGCIEGMIELPPMEDQGLTVVCFVNPEVSVREVEFTVQPTTMILHCAGREPAEVNEKRFQITEGRHLALRILFLRLPKCQFDHPQKLRQFAGFPIPGEGQVSQPIRP